MSVVYSAQSQNFKYKDQIKAIVGLAGPIILTMWAILYQNMPLTTRFLSAGDALLLY